MVYNVLSEVNTDIMYVGIYIFTRLLSNNVYIIKFKSTLKIILYELVNDLSINSVLVKSEE